MAKSPNAARPLTCSQRFPPGVAEQVPFTVVANQLGLLQRWTVNLTGSAPASQSTGELLMKLNVAVNPAPGRPTKGAAPLVRVQKRLTLAAQLIAEPPIEIGRASCRERV